MQPEGTMGTAVHISRRSRESSLPTMRTMRLTYGCKIVVQRDTTNLTAGIEGR